MKSFFLGRLVLFSVLGIFVILIGTQFPGKSATTLPSEAASTANLSVIANSTYPGDYQVVDNKGKTMAYMSPLYNNGNLTSLEPTASPVNLLASQPNSGSFYPHFVLWPANDQWTEGTLPTVSDFKVIQPTDSKTGYTEWSGTWQGANFYSTLDQKTAVAAYSGDKLYVIKSIASFHATADITNFKHLYIELGWHADDYAGVYAKYQGGAKIVNMASDTGTHYFDGLKAGPGNYLSTYKSTVLPASMALVFASENLSGSANFSVPENSVYIRSWNTNNISDHTDTVEFHINNPTGDKAAFTLKSGATVTLTYYTVINNNPNTYTWVPSITWLNGKFQY